jgi:hypothetical protein
LFEAHAAEKPPDAKSKSTAADAEFAIRWDTKEGGPRSAAEVLKQIKLEQTDKDSFEVIYFVAGQRTPTPPGFESILRKRAKKNKTE